MSKKEGGAAKGSPNIIKQELAELKAMQLVILQELKALNIRLNAIEINLVEIAEKMDDEFGEEIREDFDEEDEEPK